MHACSKQIAYNFFIPGDFGSKVLLRTNASKPPVGDIDVVLKGPSR